HEPEPSAPSARTPGREQTSTVSFVNSCHPTKKPLGRLSSKNLFRARGISILRRPFPRADRNVGEFPVSATIERCRRDSTPSLPNGLAGALGNRRNRRHWVGRRSAPAGTCSFRPRLVPGKRWPPF